MQLYQPIYLVHLQELLKHYGVESSETLAGTEDDIRQRNAVFMQLPEDVQTLVKPYLDSRFYLENSNVMPKAVVFVVNGSSFRRWLYSWLRTLIENFAEGKLLEFQTIQVITRTY